MNEKPEIKPLTESIIFELVRAFDLPQTERTKRWLKFIFGKAARIGAEACMSLDRAVAEGGLPGGTDWILPRFVKTHEARGRENIPASGPLVIASNHPASIDSIVISAHVNRPDYKIIVGDIPFLQHLPHVSQYAIYAPNETNLTGRMQVVRESIRHLKNGGALLIFPYGGIEPDSDFMPNPGCEFHNWSRSLEVLLHHVPQLQILVTMASGVISKSAFRHPVTRFRKRRSDKQRLAFTYQFARQILSGRETFGLTPRITFGEVVKGIDHQHIVSEIESAAHRTLQKHMAWTHS